MWAIKQLQYPSLASGLIDSTIHDRIEHSNTQNFNDCSPKSLPSPKWNIGIWKHGEFPFLWNILESAMSEEGMYFPLGSLSFTRGNCTPCTCDVKIHLYFLMLLLRVEKKRSIRAGQPMRSMWAKLGSNGLNWQFFWWLFIFNELTFY